MAFLHFSASTPAAKLYSTEQIRNIEQAYFESQKSPSYDLMEAAGTAAYTSLRYHWPGVKKLVCVCGKGNNAGDAYVLARLANQDGLEVKVLRLDPDKQPKNDALIAYQQIDSLSIITDENIEDLLTWADLVVDGILGTGLNGPPYEHYEKAINSINRSAKSVFALDIPSGLNADTGDVASVAIRAQRTVSFIAYKTGMVTGQARNFCGELELASLSVPASIFATFPAINQYIDVKTCPYRLQARAQTSHKGDFGHVAVCGGNRGMPGAALMASEAALRSGAGLTSAFTHREHAQVFPIRLPELMTKGLASEDEVRLDEQYDVIVIGPGLGRDAWARKLWAAAISTQSLLVVDADALNLLAEQQHKYDSWILTPHPGEAARLLGCSVQEVQADRYAAAKAICQRYGGVCVLKGAGTIVTDGHQTHVMATGNAAMAIGGMGDVLAGHIAGLLAEHRELFAAASLGAFLHSLAADQLVAEKGARGLLATELVPRLRDLLNAFTN